MEIENISKILICVEMDNGNAHQVLTSIDNKQMALRLIASIDEGLKLSSQIEPFTLDLLKP